MFSVGQRRDTHRTNPVSHRDTSSGIKPLAEVAKIKVHISVKLLILILKCTAVKVEVIRFFLRF